MTMPRPRNKLPLLTWHERPIGLAPQPAYTAYMFRPQRKLPSLPPALHERILQFVVRGPRHWLLDCALVCRAWLCVCAPVLFRTIYLNRPTDAARLARAIGHSKDSLLLLHTRRIVVRPEAAFCTDRSFVDISTSLFPFLDNLCWEPRRCNRHENVHRSTLNTKSIFKQYSNFRMLSRLALHEHEFHSFADLFRICGSLLLLRSLYLRSVSWTHTPRAIPESFRPFPPRLNLIEADCCPSVWPLLWLWAYRPSSESAAPSEIALSDLYCASELIKLCRISSAGRAILITLDDKFVLVLKTAMYRVISDSRVLVNDAKYVLRFSSPPSTSRRDPCRLRHIVVHDYDLQLSSRLRGGRVEFFSLLGKLDYLLKVFIKTPRAVSGPDRGSCTFTVPTSSGAAKVTVANTKLELLAPRWSSYLDSLLHSLGMERAEQSMVRTESRGRMSIVQIRNVLRGYGAREDPLEANEQAARMAYCWLHRTVYHTEPPL